MFVRLVIIEWAEQKWEVKCLVDLEDLGGIVDLEDLKNIEITWNWKVTWKLPEI